MSSYPAVCSGLMCVLFMEPTVSYKILTHFKLLPSTVSAFLLWRLPIEQLPGFSISNCLSCTKQNCPSIHFGHEAEIDFCEPLTGCYNSLSVTRSENNESNYAMEQNLWKKVESDRTENW